MIKKLVDTYGESAQIDITIEECAELIHAVSKYKRAKYGGYKTSIGEDYAKDKLVEAIAQAINAIYSLIYIVKIDVNMVKQQAEASDKEALYMFLEGFLDDQNEENGRS